MNHQMANMNYSKSGYSSVPQASSPRMTEAWALIEAARRMAVALEEAEGQDLMTPKVRASLREPVRLNWRLWTIFQAELSRDDTGLPTDILENMINLCNFVDKHTIKCLSDPAAENIVILIDINRNIASGLLEMPESEEGADNADTVTAQPKPAAPYQPKGPQPASGSGDAEHDTPKINFDENV